MSISKSTCIDQKRKQQCLIPYNVSFNGNIISKHDYHEYMDMRDFRNARINKLTVDFSEFGLSSKIRQYLIQLLSNTNIKVLNINGHNFTMKVLFALSYYISKNTTIQEIELVFNKINLELNNPKWFYFIKVISSRLKRVHNINYTRKNLEFFKHLLSSSNINEITFDYEYDEKYQNEDIERILYYTISTKKHLDYFEVYAYRLNLNQQYFDLLKESDNNAEIDTLLIYSRDAIECSLLFIKNAYLFNVKIIKIIEFNKKTKLLFEEILKLSRNPKNTVKKILILRVKGISYLKEFQRLLASFDRPYQYDIQNISKIFISGSEIIVNYDNNSNSFKATSPYYDSPDDLLPFLSCNNNSIEIDMQEYNKYLYLLFNKSIDDRRFSIKYINFIESGTLDHQYNKDKIESIINQMKELYNNFKTNYVHSPTTLDGLNYWFNEKNPELDVLNIIFLEFIIDMKYKLRELELIGISASYLADFLGKYKVLKSNNIGSLIIRLDSLDLENIERLYENYYFFAGKILLNFRYKDDKSKFILFRNSRLKNNNNFIDIYYKDEKYYKFDSNKEVIDYLEKVKNEEVMMNYEKNIMDYLRINYDFNNENLDLDVLFCLFSYLKKNQFIVKCVNLKFLKKGRIDYNKKIRLMNLETILDAMYRIDSKDPVPTKIRWNQFSKTIKKYCKGHNIRIFK